MMVDGTKEGDALRRAFPRNDRRQRRQEQRTWLASFLIST